VPPLVQQACDALSKICTLGAPARSAVRRAGAADALVHAIRHLPTKTTSPPKRDKAVASAEPVVVDITDLNAEADSTRIDGSGSTVALASPEVDGGEATRTGAEDVQLGKGEARPATDLDALTVSRAVCHALTNLANGDLACKLAVAEADGTAVITGAMRKWADDEMLLKISVGGLANIAGGDASCLQKVLKVQGVALVVKALKKHGPTSGPFTADACLALANFAAGKGEGAEAVSDQGGIDALATALRAHGASEPRVREWACAAMANLASSGSNDISDNLVDSTALRAVVGAMGHCAPTETKALDFAVGVWAHLGRSPERCEACVAAGFVEATVKAILAAPFSPPSVRFLEEACRALATIAFQDKSGHSILREAGALKALQMMLDRFPKEVKVQEMGRALLSEIS